MVLTTHFLSTDMCPVYMLIASKDSHDRKLLKMKSLRSMNVLVPELANMSVSLINAMADIEAEDDCPMNITVK